MSTLLATSSALCTVAVRFLPYRMYCKKNNYACCLYCCSKWGEWNVQNNCKNVYPITLNIIDTQSDTQKGQTTCMHYMCKLGIACSGGRELWVWLNWPCIVDIVSRGLPVCCHWPQSTLRTGTHFWSGDEAKHVGGGESQLIGNHTDGVLVNLIGSAIWLVQ